MQVRQIGENATHSHVLSPTGHLGRRAANLVEKATRRESMMLIGQREGNAAHVHVQRRVHCRGQDGQVAVPHVEREQGGEQGVMEELRIRSVIPSNVLSIGAKEVNIYTLR